MSLKGPHRRSGWSQGLYSISSTMKEAYLGMYRETEDGRGFRYARAGGSDLNAGFLGVMAEANAAHVNEAITAAIAVGADQLTLTITAGAAILENQLAGGQFQINDAAGEGHTYPIESNTALLVGGTAIDITLAYPIKVALTTDSEYTLVWNPYAAVIESTTPGLAAGCAMVAVTTLYYYWAQTHGLGGGYTYTTTDVGDGLEQSADTAGYVDVIDTAHTEEIVGTSAFTDGVAAEFKPVFWKID